MRSMQATYEAKGWDRGPHFFIALGTSDDGIFAMTPPELPGIHAGGCNPHRFGVEVVGDFSLHPMSHAQLVLLSEVIASLHDWTGIGPDVVAHRDCMPGRTCPGDAAYAQKDDITALVAFAQMRPEPQPPQPAPAYTDMSPLMAQPLAPRSQLRFTIPKASEYTQGEADSFFDEYYTICTDIGLDPIVAIAQCLHETGNLTSWWCSRPRRNPAGIGVTGRKQASATKPPGEWALHPDGLWHEGVSFRTWVMDAIPEHIGRLLAYALPANTGTPAQRELIRRALARRPLLPRYRGCASVLRDLGGTWAVPGVGYGIALAKRSNVLIGVL